MLPLLAQLVAPPIQSGPVRLPGPDAGEQRLDRKRPAPKLDVQPLEQAPPITPAPSPTPGLAPSPAPSPTIRKDLPEVRGLKRYGALELTKIFQPCLAIADPGERLKACAASLTARLVADGYVNSRVFAETKPAPGYLDVVEGRIVEVRVIAKDAWLSRRVTRLLRPLQGDVLNLAEVERQLRLLQRQGGVKSIRSNLSRLGSDPTQAVLTVNVELGKQPLQGDFSVRNDGSNGSGEGRAVGTLVKGGLVTPGDVLLLYGELDVANNPFPNLGAVISSASYTYPLTDQLNLTGSFGYSRRNLVELTPPADQFSTRQFQGLGQLEWVFKETLTQRFAAFAGLSLNRSTTFLAGNALPTILPEVVRTPQTGYLRVGLSGSGLTNSVGWSGNVYALQGIGAFSPSNQINELAQVGISPGQATAVGTLISAAWGFAPNWQLNLRAAGQVAGNPLTSSMQFTLGSDVGLRGLPGQLISGDNGWLGTSELVWTFWQKKKQALQLVPFFGYGGVNTRLQGRSFTQDVGSGGVLARWLAGDNWSFEAGWANQFATNTLFGPWTNWSLGKGFYGKVQYRF
ncbi:MAG: ShlB/FhaC/HecB family hemolysin secretion/activation protein [Synechococcaceae cyanobacterium ELA445]